MEILGEHILCYNNIRKVVERDHNAIPNDQYIYEVIRLERGVLLFLEDHLERLQDSIRMTGIREEFDTGFVSSQLRKLSALHNNNIGNLEIFLRPENELINGILQICAQFIPYQYPSEEDYQEGVRLGIMKAERDNPEIKVMQSGLRQNAVARMQKEEFNEVLLETADGFITEGSRSNIFFVKGETVYTPPAEQILSGITRKKAIDICKQLGIPIEEKYIHTSMLNDFDAAFNTSTSRNILPVKQIGELSFNPWHSLIQTIMTAFDQMVLKYTSDHCIKYRVPPLT